jgi:hypothetical protein
LDFRLACVEAAGHVPAAKDGNQAPPSRRVCPGVLDVQLARVTLPRAIPKAFPSHRAADVHQVYLCPSQMVQANDLREVLARQITLAPVCLAVRAKSATWQLHQPVDSCQ